jgi:hypothetical protein
VTLSICFLFTHIAYTGAIDHERAGLVLRPTPAEFGENHHRQHVEQQPLPQVGWIMDRAAEAELDVSPRELAEDVTSVGQRPCEPIQLGHYQGVTGSASSQR